MGEHSLKGEGRRKEERGRRPIAVKKGDLRHRGKGLGTKTPAKSRI